MLREKVVFVIIKVRFLTLINTFRRKIMSLLYISFDILLIGYIFYSWYWQANIDYKARFRSSSVIWALIFLLIGFYLDYFTDPTVLMNVFIATFLLMSIIDGVSGLAKKRLVVSGYFKRTVKYSDIAHVTLITVPNPKKPTVMAIFQTNNRQAYYLRFSQQVSDVIVNIRKYLGSNVGIEVQSMM
ncbi:hypothetical protein EFP49_08040 [Lactobacillus johnsonii]|jgi:hypothetical protein|uniref:Uncharacterized protein n=4 Tax=Lactobacillus johnsonii TaxID=33959 RepID=D0R212_LACJF|nr:hypothetical protein A3P31_09510 [Lactobacillus johnsonii]EEJ60382.1 hypothetical protein HMPREF0528_0404 [Lactobacillus johnsonii ATCC 33200]PEG78117.1 hypothetical protein CP370_01205 [Lactobacillus sp. UMNPBX19]CAX66041.1 hypothetical protein predicted by Glimmer/Critica [Lactobacillus johnsonii FI9785]ARW76300.1 hypothetical protein A3P32_03030 [Lactobacillus johnsonii]